MTAARMQAEREARFASLKALQTQLELHAGYMVALRDKHYAAIPDNFDDDVRPKLEKKLKGVRIRFVLFFFLSFSAVFFF